MTMTAVTNARNYAWGDWMIGIMRSFLSGGAAALGGLTGSGIAGLTMHQTITVTTTGFLFMGLYRLGEFLQLHGAPDKVQEKLESAAVATKEAATAISEAKSAATKDKS